MKMPAYTQGLMDLGATICTRNAPRCSECPLHKSCVAYQQQRVDELPVPRRARAVPVRKAHWLVLRRADSVLLEALPPRGGRGGLLALPSFSTRAALRSAVRSMGEHVQVAALPARRHTFTHFSLEFTPHVVRIERATQARTLAAPATTGQRSVWLTLRRAESAALPAPVRTLLIDLRDRMPANGGSAGAQATRTRSRR